MLSDDYKIENVPKLDFEQLEHCLNKVITNDPESCTVSLHGAQRKINKARNWFVFGDDHGLEIGVAFQATEGLCISPFARFEVLERLLKYLPSISSGDGQEESLKFKGERFTFASPCYEHLFKWQSLHPFWSDRKKNTGAFWITSNGVYDFNFVSDNKKILEKVVLANAELCLLPPAIIASDTSLRLSEAKVVLSSSYTNRLYCELHTAKDEKYFNLKIKGVKEMNKTQNTEGYPVTVKLATISLTYDDLMQLRPGMTIRCPRPRELKGEMLVADSSWAELSIEIENEQILLKVNNLTNP